MPGFYVQDGPYRNTKAPNPKCCSDPGILCPACARQALAAPPSKLFDWRESQEQISANSLSANELADEDLLPLPRVEPPAPQKRADDKQKPGSAPAGNLPAGEDDDLLPLTGRN